MGTQHQNRSPHGQFKQSPHKQRVCSQPFVCGEGGRFVYASAALTGFLDPKWYELPRVPNVLYRKMVSVHTWDHYYDDGLGGKVYWHTATMTVEAEFHPTCPGILLSFEATGSASGLLYRSVAGNPGVGYRREHEDYVEILDPMGSPTKVDNFPVSGWPGGAVTSMTATPGYVYCESQRDSGAPDFIIDEKTTSETTATEPYDPASISGIVADLLATVPLSSVSAANNLVTIGRDIFAGPGEGDCPIEITLASCLARDTHCTPGQDREQTFTPAALMSGLPIYDGLGDGVPHTTLYYRGCYWGGGVAILPEYPSYDTAAATGKKSLLMRESPEEFVVHHPYDPVEEEFVDPVCLGSDVSVCRRFYYPDGADAGGTGPNSENFTFSGDGIIYREIPVIVLVPTGCPSGIPPFINPCP